MMETDIAFYRPTPAQQAEVDLRLFAGPDDSCRAAERLKHLEEERRQHALKNSANRLAVLKSIYLKDREV